MLLISHYTVRDYWFFWFFGFFFSVIAIKWINLGCYKDIRYSRALPHPFKMIDVDYQRVYPHLKQLFDVCRREAERHGFHYFGIQFYYECWGGSKEDQYDKYGNSTECGIGTQGYGVGFAYTNHVYGRALSGKTKL